MEFAATHEDIKGSTQSCQPHAMKGAHQAVEPRPTKFVAFKCSSSVCWKLGSTNDWLCSFDSPQTRPGSFARRGLCERACFQVKTAVEGVLRLDAVKGQRMREAKTLRSDVSTARHARSRRRSSSPPRVLLLFKHRTGLGPLSERGAEALSSSCRRPEGQGNA